MASNQSEMLLSLNTIDRSIVEKEKDLKESSDILDKLRAQFNKKSAILQSVEVQLESATQTHSSEENKLKEEEVKIVERRKQLTSLGGAKSAKLVERELDIAKRIMETLEQDVLSAIEKMELFASKRNALVSDLDEVKEKLDVQEASHAELATTAQGEIEALKKEKKNLMVTLDARLQNLYKRVESRYRGDAIALAESGSCRSCFRSLPAQTFNQVMAGYNLIQCPGCSRILVYVATEEAASTP